MEPNSRADLTALVANWRTRAAQEEGFCGEQLAELESHLLDTVEHLLEAGLNQEEAFLIASRRLGQPQELADEYQVADPGLRWRKRLTWMLAGVVCISLIQGVSFAMAALIEPFLNKVDLGAYLFKRGLATLMALILIGFLALRTQGLVLRKLGNRFNSPGWQWMLLGISSTPLLITVAWSIVATMTNQTNFQSLNNPWWAIPSQLSLPIYSFMLIWNWRSTHGASKHLLEIPRGTRN